MVKNQVINEYWKRNNDSVVSSYRRSQKNSSMNFENYTVPTEDDEIVGKSQDFTRNKNSS